MRRQHVHAARDAARIRQRDPRGDVLVRLEAEVSRVLVPRGKRRGTRVLDEERAPENEDVGTDHVLDSIEHARVPHELVRPGQVNVRGAAPLELGLLQRRAQVRFRSLEITQIPGRFLSGQSRHRKQKPVMVIVAHLLFGQCFHEIPGIRVY